MRRAINASHHSYNFVQVRSYARVFGQVTECRTCCRGQFWFPKSLVPICQRSQNAKLLSPIA